MTKQTDDPRVTAYVVGELTNEELATFEDDLAGSTTLQAEVEATRETLAAIEQAFAAESVAEMTDAERESMATPSKVELASAGWPPEMKGKGKTPWGMLAVAGLLLVVVGAWPAYQYVQYQREQSRRMTSAGSFKNMSMAFQDAEKSVDRVNAIDSGYSTAAGVRSSDDDVSATTSEPADPTTLAAEVFDNDSPTKAIGLDPSGNVSPDLDMSFVQDSTTTTTPQTSRPSISAQPMPTTQPEVSLPSLGDRSGGGKPYDAGQPSSSSSNGEAGESQSSGQQQGQGGEESSEGRPKPSGESGQGDGKPSEDAPQLSLPQSGPQQSNSESQGDGSASSGERNGSKGGDQGSVQGKKSDGKSEGERNGKKAVKELKGLKNVISESEVARESKSKEPKASAPKADASKGGGKKGKDSNLEPLSIVKLEEEREKYLKPRQEFTPTKGKVLDSGQSGDRYALINDNPFKSVTNDPLSTFSIDVDTASYSKVRMYLMQQNTFPRPDAVRIEELVNYFDYDYTPPGDQDEHPFSAAMQVTECPWNPQHRLARVGIKGKVIEDDRPFSNLVFLLDVSGSMNRPNKMPLMIEGMKMLVNELTENDQVAIVVYAGAAGVVLDTTTGDRKKKILEALERLRAGGSTNGGQGIKLAYQLAQDHFIQGGTNRVILCSDGDFNVGVTGTDELVRLAEENAKSKIFLSVLGFGMGNHNDDMMEKISNKGNGNYAFIDTEAEAHKVLVEQMGGTLVTIAKDVKIQIEFNPQEVTSYRLIGYENRVLAAQDFNDDTKDAGEIGAGHTVTALYELVPTNAKDGAGVAPIDPLKYQKADKPTKAARSGELLTLKLRYKQPEGDTSTLMTYPIKDDGRRFGEADKDFRFAAAVASFGMLLRRSPHKGDANFGSVEEIATEAATGDKHGYRTEFVEMVKRAKQLSGQ